MITNFIVGEFRCITHDRHDGRYLRRLKSLARPERFRHARDERIVGLFQRRRIEHDKILLHLPAVRKQMPLIEVFSKTTVTIAANADLQRI